LKWSPRRREAVALAAVLIACGCQSPSRGPSRPDASPSAPAPGNHLCADVHGAWDANAGRCTLSKNGANGVHQQLNATYPADLVDNPTAGPVLTSFVQKFFADTGDPDINGTGDATLVSAVFAHGASTKSVVFHSDWFFASMPHPSGQITTFTLDLSQGKQLALADLYCPGVDPLQAIPPVARPFVAQALTGSPLQVEQFEPGNTQDDLADNYRAWALDGDDLVLYLPAGRGPGGVAPGFVTVHVPLAKLAPTLREKGCSATTSTPAH
jgi:hypothetical protein